MITFLMNQVWKWPGETEWADSTKDRIWQSTGEWTLGLEEPGQ